MRHFSKGAFKKFFDDRLMESRDTLHLTQKQTSSILQMAPRSFIEMEHGNNSCSGLTLALYLIYLCDNPLAFLSDLRSILEVTELPPVAIMNAEAICSSSYRLPLSVKLIKRDPAGKRHAVCPRCGMLLDRTDAAYCEHCGQKLDWNSFPGPIVN